MKPKTMACAIKGVYASLWNKRAVEERSFGRIDHATAGMGLAIVRRYAEHGVITANSVVITRVLNSSGVYGYTFSSQVGENIVTNPAPDTASETIIAAFLPDVAPAFTVTRFAKPTPESPTLDHTVMTTEQMQTMLESDPSGRARVLPRGRGLLPGQRERLRQRAVRRGEAARARHGDQAVRSGEFHVKQVREFSGK